MKYLLTTTLALFFSVFAHAQMSEPVKWTFKSEKINRAEYEITLIADIEDGWYVYSQYLSKRGPVPTQINFNQNPNVVLDGKPQEVGDKKEDFDQNFNMNVVKLSGKTQFIQKIRVAGGVPEVNGKLMYMTCNGEMCMPPKQISFNVVLK